MSKGKDIIVAVRDFTTLPGARYKSDGTGSAQEFFEKRIEPVLKQCPNSLTIDFDGTWGYASSFMSELTVKLLQSLGSIEEVRKIVQIKSEDEPGLAGRFWEYTNEDNAQEN